MYSMILDLMMCINDDDDEINRRAAKIERRQQNAKKKKGKKISCLTIDRTKYDVTHNQSDDGMRKNEKK